MINPVIVRETATKLRDIPILVRFIEWNARVRYQAQSIQQAISIHICSCKASGLERREYHIGIHARVTVSCRYRESLRAQIFLPKSTLMIDTAGKKMTGSRKYRYQLFIYYKKK
jgi:hypothetical protein